MDPYNLQRFLLPQEKDYSMALAQIKQGEKRTHWMWYIFPQLKGLGQSSMAVFYGLSDIEEAQEYLDHPILGRRLVEISEALLYLRSNSAKEVFGSPDDLKLRSCMTLFSELPDSNPVFLKVIGKFFDGEKDRKTLELLNLLRF